MEAQSVSPDRLAAGPVRAPSGAGLGPTGGPERAAARLRPGLQPGLARDRRRAGSALRWGSVRGRPETDGGPGALCGPAPSGVPSGAGPRPTLGSILRAGFVRAQSGLSSSSVRAQSELGPCPSGPGSALPPGSVRAPTGAGSNPKEGPAPSPARPRSRPQAVRREGSGPCLSTDRTPLPQHRGHQPQDPRKPAARPPDSTLGSPRGGPAESDRRPSDRPPVHWPLRLCSCNHGPATLVPPPRPGRQRPHDQRPGHPGSAASAPTKIGRAQTVRSPWARRPPTAIVPTSCSAAAGGPATLRPATLSPTLSGPTTSGTTGGRPDHQFPGRPRPRRPSLRPGRPPPPFDGRRLPFP